MNLITSFTHTVLKNTKILLGGFLLSVLTLVSLYAFEMTPLVRPTTNEALAWHCVAMTADPIEIVKGGSTTLSWSFENDTDITVTIDMLSGKEWTGVSGSTVVFPTETTTYTAIAHKASTTDTQECSVTVKVTTPPDEPLVPVCPFTASADVTVVDFNGGKTRNDATLIRSDKNAAQSFIEKTVSLPMGTYTVKTASWDGYVGREIVSQPNEQWNIEVLSTSGVLGSAGPTTDIEDNVFQNTQSDTFTNAFTTTQNGTNVKVVHAVYPDASSPNSVVPVCVAFEKKPVEEPKVPTCPFTASADVIVVDFNGGKARTDATLIRSDKTASQSEIEKTGTLPIGTYTVKTASWDGYNGREFVSQPNESWNVEVLNTAGSVLGTAGPTTDLADYVVQDTKNNTYINAFTTTEVGGIFKVINAAYPDTSSPNSVVPVCVAFEKKPVVEVPTCDMVASPNSITKGDSSTLSWDSTLVSSVSIPGIGTNLSSASSTPVSPTTTTTYTGTFYTTEGGTLTCDATVTVVPPSDNPTPSCLMNVSSSKVNKGDTVTLNWSSNNTNFAFLDQGIGTTTLSGSKDIVITSAISFTGLFKDDAGKEVTCAASVSINGGGGKCLNCDDDDDDDDDDPDDPHPSIVLSKTISKVGSFITLDQVPYTGFEAGPLLTTFFWLTVLALSVLIAYVATRFHPLERIQLAFLQKATNNFDSFEFEENLVENAIQKSASATLQNPIAIAEVSNTEVPRSDAISIIEDMAHKENILLSPEALRLMYASMKNLDVSPSQYLTGLFAIAKSEYPQEDGWILLSKERAEKLLGKNQNNIVLNVSDTNSDNQTIEEKPFRIEPTLISKKNIQVSAVGSQVASSVGVVASGTYTSPDDTTTTQFIESLVNLEKKKVFDMLRTFTSRGNDVGAFITSVVRKLDEVYKHRIEGGHTPDKDVANKTATWSNGDFENVLGILVECIDYSYSNNHIGTKIALTKAFDHFEKMAK